jgi:hypothetical protein
MSKTDCQDPIADRLAISDLLTHYSHCLDTRQLELLAIEVFAADADVDYGWGNWHSGREVTEWMIATFEDFAGTLHAISNERISLDGDEASSTCCVQAYHWLPAGPGADRMRPADFVFAGMYEDRHRRTAAGWRIAWRRFRRLGVSSLAVGELPPFMRLNREEKD